MRLDELDLVGEVREVGRQDRRGELAHAAYGTRRRASASSLAAEGRDEHPVGTVAVRPEADPRRPGRRALDLDRLEVRAVAQDRVARRRRSRRAGTCRPSRRAGRRAAGGPPRPRRSPTWSAASRLSSSFAAATGAPGGAAPSRSPSTARPRGRGRTRRGAAGAVASWASTSGVHAEALGAARIEAGAPRVEVGRHDEAVAADERRPRSAALPPGAAHASSTRSPGCGSSARTTNADAWSWTANQPSANPGKRRRVAPVDEQAGPGRAVARPTVAARLASAASSSSTVGRVRCSRAGTGGRARRGPRPRPPLVGPTQPRELAHRPRVPARCARPRRRRRRPVGHAADRSASRRSTAFTNPRSRGAASPTSRRRPRAAAAPVNRSWYAPRRSDVARAGAHASHGRVRRAARAPSRASGAGGSCRTRARSRTPGRARRGADRASASGHDDGSSTRPPRSPGGSPRAPTARADSSAAGSPERSPGSRRAPRAQSAAAMRAAAGGRDLEERQRAPSVRDRRTAPSPVGHGSPRGRRASSRTRLHGPRPQDLQGLAAERRRGARLRRERARPGGTIAAPARVQSSTRSSGRELRGERRRSVVLRRRRDRRPRRASAASRPGAPPPSRRGAPRASPRRPRARSAPRASRGPGPCRAPRPSASRVTPVPRPREDRALHRRRAAPARQQREVQVHARRVGAGRARSAAGARRRRPRRARPGASALERLEPVARSGRPSTSTSGRPSRRAASATAVGVRREPRPAGLGGFVTTSDDLESRRRARAPRATAPTTGRCPRNTTRIAVTRARTSATARRRARGGVARGPRGRARSGGARPCTARRPSSSSRSM